MNIYCPFRTPREVCYSVGDVVDRKVVKLVRRPWNQYEPDISSWWLTPSSDWPAYRYGKFYFDWDWSDKDTILCGLYIEKGIDPKARTAYPSEKGTRLIMDSNWTWYRLLQDFQNHSIERIVKNVAHSLPSSIKFRIDGGYIPDPASFDPYAPRFSWDLYQLLWQQKSNEFKAMKVKSEANLLNELVEVKTFNDLYLSLKKFNESAWIWVDFFISIKLRIAQEKDKFSESNQLWGASDIWDKFLCHFLAWVF